MSALAGCSLFLLIIMKHKKENKKEKLLKGRFKTDRRDKTKKRVRNNQPALIWDLPAAQGCSASNHTGND